MSLIFSDEIKKQLANELACTKTHLHIISAYCKYNALEFIQSHISHLSLSKKMMVRFAFNDILSGASDLHIYEFCKSHGWQLYVRFDLHAKTYIFDKIRCIAGSANLTSRGIGIVDKPNYEIAMLSEISNGEMKRVEGLFNSAILVNDELYSMMMSCLESQTSGVNSKYDDWSDDILILFKPQIKVLFTYEFPNCDSLSELREDSLDFLGLSPGCSKKQIKSAFATSNIYSWLIDKLKTYPNNEMYFGTLSTELHNVIINEPRPYRKEVKNLQSNMLNWIIELNMNEVVIDRPSHSQRIRLVK